MENNSAFWKDFETVNGLFKKAFIQMPGGQAQDKEAQDPAAGGMPPPGMDPAAGGMPPPGMDPAMGGMPPGMDPAMGGMPPPGMDPAAMGGMPPPMDPMMGGMPPPGADVGAPGSAPGSPMITISLDQLFEIIQKVLGLAKKVGANGQGIQQAAPQEAQPGLTADQLKSTIYEALASMGGGTVA